MNYLLKSIGDGFCFDLKAARLNAPVVILMLFFVGGAFGATLSVTSTGDVQIGAAGCADGCSLREAITTAADSGDTINFASPLFDTARTVTLVGSELNISKNLTITGRGARLTTVRRADDPNFGFRLFFLNSGFTMSISGITITNGLEGQGGGGGIFNNGGTLTLDGVSVSGNYSQQPAAGVRAQSGTTIINNSCVCNNTSDNQAGGITAVLGNLTITNTTISGNIATGQGGPGTQGAGGLFKFGSVIINLTNVTISNNRYEFVGGDPSSGGIFNRLNMPGLNINNSIIAGNFVAEGGDADIRGSVNSGGYNLIGVVGSSTGFSAANNDILDQPANLGALGNNGGQTDSQMPLTNSPAIDNGSSSLTADQRGAARPFDNPMIANAAGGNGSDIGALEVQVGPTAAPVTLSGRLVTTSRRGLSNAYVLLTGADGTSRTVLTNSFGYFRFPDVAAGETYILTVFSKRYRFAPQIVNPKEDLDDLMFVAEP